MDKTKIMSNPRLKEYASRQIMKENNLLQAEELGKMLQNADVVTKYAKRFIAADIRELYGEVCRIDSATNKAEKFAEIENLVFDFGTRIPDIIELLELDNTVSTEEMVEKLTEKLTEKTSS